MPKPNKGIERTKFQKGEERWIQRTQINPAPYNPRVIGEGAEKRLKAKMKTMGLLGTLIWNERTGNLVSGHQRLKQLDSLEGYPAKCADYEVRVTVLDLDEKTEIEANVFLNNPSTQGEWDIEALGALNQDFGVSFDAMGFTTTDVDLLFDGDSRFSELFSDAEEVKATKEKIQEVREARDKSMTEMKRAQSTEFYFIVVCQSEKAKVDLMKAIGVPPLEEFINGALVARKLGVAVDER